MKSLYMKANLTLIPGLLFSILVASNVTGQTSFYGSTVAYIRTPTEIVVGADSIMVAAEDPSMKGTACKIIQIESSNLFIAMVGLCPYASADFNYIPEVIQAYHSKKTIKGAADTFSKNIIIPLTKKVKNLRDNPRVNYARDFEGKAVVSIMFFGFEKNIPVVCQREFVAITSPTNKIEIHLNHLDCPGDCNNKVAANILREHDAVKKAMAMNPQSFNIKTSGVTAIVEKIIQTEIDYFKGKEPCKVGPPISILQITKNGAQWKKYEPPCHEIQSYIKEPKPISKKK